MDAELERDVINFLRVVCGECKTCPLRHSADCTQCVAPGARALLMRIDAPPPEPGAVRVADRRQAILDQLRDGPRAAQQILCGDCSKSLKTMTLRWMCQRGMLKREQRDGTYFYAIPERR